MTEPKMKQFEVTAVIPTGQYANLQPKITIESDDFDTAYKMAMPYIERISQEYAENGKGLGKAPAISVIANDKSIVLTSFPDNKKIEFFPGSHSYKDAAGHEYMSGSRYSKQYEHPFNKKAIIPRVAKSYGVSNEDVEALWQAKSDASTTLGTAVHQALETYGKWHDLNNLVGKEHGIHSILQPIVDKFFTPERLKEEAMYEVFVVDLDKLRCGQIDRLVITAPKHCIIEDYKTNTDLHKQNSKQHLKPPYNDLPETPMSKYILQLNFYRAIVEASGWIVDGMLVHWWNNEKLEWDPIEVKKVEII